MISKETAERSISREGCEGWTLVSTSKLHVLQERMPAGTAEQRHLHDHVQQFYFVLKGTASVELGSTVERLRAGEGVEIAAGVPHQIRNESAAEPLEFLVISTGPPRDDRRDLP
jgi:mannose-6-phosphate isomerase-like protein (cupin superfamily)